MSSRSTAVVAGSWLVLLGLSITLSVLAAARDTLPGDTGIAAWSQGLAFPGETLSDGVRALTFTELVLAAGGALALVLWLIGRRREALIFAAGLIVLPLLQAGIKEIVDRPRPGPESVVVRAAFDSPSFPSGHVMSSVYLYGYLLYLVLSPPPRSPARAALAIACGVILAVSGPANVWLGVHWPSDVLGGYAWGLVLLVPVAVACRRYRLG